MMQDSIRLLLLDEDGLFRSSLSRLLSAEPGFEVACECGTTAHALEALGRTGPNVVLIDLKMGSEQTNEFITAARAAGYSGHFLIVAKSPDVRESAVAVKAGVSGVFLKSEPPERLVRAIHHVAEGDIWINPHVIRKLAEQFVNLDPREQAGSVPDVITDRESTVLKGIVSGLTNRKIGDAMGISESSVKNIVQRLFGKAGVKTRSQLVRLALEGSIRAHDGGAHHLDTAVPIGR